MGLIGRIGLRNGFKSLEVAANIANKPFGQKSIAVAVDPAKIKVPTSAGKLKAEPVTRKGRFGGRLLFPLEWP